MEAACSEKDAGLEEEKAGGVKQEGVQDRRPPQKGSRKDHCA